MAVQRRAIFASPDLAAGGRAGTTQPDPVQPKGQRHDE